MTLHRRHNLTLVINARGSFTPLGVSRSSPTVGGAVAAALQDYMVIDELQQRASEMIAAATGADGGAVVHCAAAGITLAIAATMTGTSADLIRALPDANGMRHRVVLPAPHQVNYGHPITQAIRLAGAQPVIAGRHDHCSLDEIERQLDQEQVACLLLVSSRLTGGPPFDLEAAVALARRRAVPTLIDGAAQDMRIKALLATGADLVIVSAQKYLASPTAGLVIGNMALIQAVRAQERGIGRGMKASKEAIIGVMTALEERAMIDIEVWQRHQSAKLNAFVERVRAIDTIDAWARPDPAGMPFARAHLKVVSQNATMTARSLANALRQGSPSIWVMDDHLDQGELVLELVQVTAAEIDIIVERITALMA